MSKEQRLIYVGMHDGVCAIASDDGGRTWKQGPVTHLPHAAARLAVSPLDPRRAWLAAYEAGVYRTDDGGATGLARIPTPPTTPTALWPILPRPTASTSAANPPRCSGRKTAGPPGVSARASGRCRSPATGDFTPPPAILTSATWSRPPVDSGLVYAASRSAEWSAPSDGGASWRQLPGLDDDIHCLHLGSDKPARVYAATASAPFRSDNGGDHWEQINGGLERRYTLHIAAAPDDADLVLVTVSENARRKSPQFYRSTDGGDSWRLVQGLGQGEEAEDMVVAFEWDPNDASEVYAGTDGGNLYRSRDRGESWEQLPVTMPAVAVGALAVAP